MNILNSSGPNIHLKNSPLFERVYIYPTREINDEVYNKYMVSKKHSNICAMLSHI